MIDDSKTVAYEDMHEGVTALKKGRFKEAHDKFFRLASIGSARAAMGLGHIYEVGSDDVPRDFTKAFYWFTKAHQLGLSAAIAALGRMYYYGRGVPQDYVKAFSLYSQLEHSHRGSAIFRLGIMYESGQGVAKDIKKASACYKRSAKLGNVMALKRLGVLMLCDGNLLGAAAWATAIFKFLIIVVSKGGEDDRLRVT